MKKRIEKRQKKPRARPKHISLPKIKPDKEISAEIKHFFGLGNLKAPMGAKTKKKLLGRGPSSGHGKTSTRGSKGQSSRAGRDFYLGFEGGAVPLIRKIPKRGFSNLRTKKRYQIVNINDLGKLKEPKVDPQVLEEKGLIKDKDRLVKILGEGELCSPLEVKAHAFSKAAKEKIENLGGKIQIIDVDV